MGGFSICAGLEQVVEYIQNLHFEPEDIEYLRGRNMFSEEFLDYLKNFKFEGDNTGLVVAEVELSSVDETFEKPSFIGKEVTGDRRYYNSQLSQRPYVMWREE